MNINNRRTHLVWVLSDEQQIEGYGSDHVDDEPSPQVVDGYLARVTDHFVVRVDVSGAEIDEDVNDEHDVDDEVNDDDWAVIVQPLFVQEECGHVRCEYGRVDDEQQDNPVPDRFKGGVV